LYYICHSIIIHLDSAKALFLSNAMHATQDHKRRSNAEPQRKRRSIIVIGSVHCVDENL